MHALASSMSRARTKASKPSARGWCPGSEGRSGRQGPFLGSGSAAPCRQGRSKGAPLELLTGKETPRASPPPLLAGKEFSMVNCPASAFRQGRSKGAPSAAACRQGGSDGDPFASACRQGNPKGTPLELLAGKQFRPLRDGQRLRREVDEELTVEVREATGRFLTCREARPRYQVASFVQRRPGVSA